MGYRQGVAKAALILFWTVALTAFLLAILPNPPQFSGLPSDKVQHAAAFAALAGLASAAFPNTSPIRLLVWLSGFGALIEVVQGTAVIHRDAEVLDWVADTAACALVLAGVQLWRWRAGRR